MNYIFTIIGILLLIVIWSKLNEKSIIKKIKENLKRQWGNIPEEEYSEERMNSLRYYYQSIADASLDIDDITWNDIDMDDIYQMINNTQSAIGEEYLYALLRKPCFSNNELEERNRLMNFFQASEKERIELQIKLKLIGKLKRISVFQYIDHLYEQESHSNIPHYLMAFGLIFSISMIFINSLVGSLGTLFFVSYNIYRYYKRKANIENYLIIFSYLIRLLDKAKGITQLQIKEIESYTKELEDEVKVFQKFKRGSGVLVSNNASGSMMDLFLDYGRMLFHFDLIKYNKMLTFLQNNKSHIASIYKIIGFLDSMLAAASFRDTLDYYVLPDLTKSSNIRLKVEDLYHPLLEEPITNSIAEEKSVMITGSNASGKSTFIKTLAINAILSQSLYTSVSRSYKANFFMVYSSMALRDSIFRNESYYIVEIKSLKRIIDRVNKDIPTLCFIDEVLRGTNTLERIAASSRILSSLAKRNAMVFAATHDIELTHILEKQYSNYHFQEHIQDNQITFDYKLYEGRAVSKNAIKLLGMLGYSEDIIEEAEKATEIFLKTGEWNRL